MCVLAVLARGDSYAYEIVHTLAHSMAMSEGTIYALMGRLQAEKWVSSYQGESGSGPSRKYYCLTEHGRESLMQMQQELSILNFQKIKCKKSGAAIRRCGRMA